MMSIKISLFLFIITFAMAGCAILKTSPFLSPEIPKASYTGRGTNAGPMLVGALGATGLAVGIAIDQGIAKNFHQQIEIHKAKYIKNISSLLQGYFPKAVNFSLSEIKFTAAKNDDNWVNTRLVIQVEESSAIEFVTVELEKIKFDDLKTSDAFWKNFTNKLKNGF